MQYWTVDKEYVETLGMQILQGRNFSAEFPSDSSAVIMNETAVKRFGFANPIGQKITTYDFNNGKLDPSKTITYHIVGVVEDFHFESLRQNITPLSCSSRCARPAMRPTRLRAGPVQGHPASPGP